MSYLFRLFLAMAFPWILFLIKDKPLPALIAIILQATIIGWIPASLWAWNESQSKAIETKQTLKQKKTTPSTHTKP